MTAGIRELKSNLSQFIRKIEAGERVVITVHGRVVAQLVPHESNSGRAPSAVERFIASGVITAPVEQGDPLEHRPRLRLPKGTAQALINEDRE